MPKNSLEWELQQLRKKHDKLEKKYLDTKIMLKSAIKSLKA